MPRAQHYFVYINDRRHIWRFVYFARWATCGEDAIAKAWAEARATGQPIVEGYMAVPAEAITTMEAPEPESHSGDTGPQSGAAP